MAYSELISLGGNGIIDILTDDANAAASQILSGYTAYVKGKKVTGNIPSQGAQTITPGTTDKTIASGKYLSGTQTIKGDANLTAENIKAGTSIFGVSGTFTSDANAIGWADLRAGKTAYVNGQRIEGNLKSLDQGTPNWCENVRIYNDRFEFAPPPGIHGCWWDGGQYCYMSYEQVRNAIGLTADKIAAGNQILGIWGTYTGRGGERALLFIENRGTWLYAPGFNWQWNGSGFTCLTDATYRLTGHAVVHDGSNGSNYFKVILNGGVAQQVQTSFWHGVIQFDTWIPFGSTATLTVEGSRSNFAAVLEIVRI